LTADSKVVWVTGAGSGIGRASAMMAARAGWRVALSGRRKAALESVAEEIRSEFGEALVVPLDVTQLDEVPAAASAVSTHWGHIDGLVLAAGLNTPLRSWADQKLTTFDQILTTNLIAPAHIVSAILPQLRESHGVVVVVSSYSAWTFNPIAGVAYSASKSALVALARTLNAQESLSGVRACHLCPGDVNTDFLSLRPTVPNPTTRDTMLDPTDVARAIQFVLDAPLHVRFDELVVSPVSQV
jgi:NADP-dependent 3-hydroxy acid dehydrogenase YdfG